MRVRLNKYGQGTGLLRFLQSTFFNSLIKKSLVCALIKQDETYPNAIIRNFAQILYRIILIDMRMRKHYIILLLTALILYTCGSLEADKTLADVGAYINERPDSALTVLQSMSERNLNTRELKARHSLLYTMALDKNYIDTTDMGVIAPAFDFFSRHGNPADKMAACFYYGVIHQNRKEDDRALYYYSMALEDSSAVRDNRCKELVNSAISNVYSRSHNSPQELKYALDALKYGRMAGDSVGIWSVTGHLAACYANMHMWDDAERTYNEFFSMPVYDSLTYYRRKVNHAKAILLGPQPDAKRCIGILEEVARHNPLSVEGYCLYAAALQLSGNEQAADIIIGQLESMAGDNEILKLWRYRIRKNQGRDKEALADLESSLAAQDSIVTKALYQSLLQAQQDFLMADTARLKNENALEKQRITFIIIIALLAIASLVLLYERKRNHLNRKIEQLTSLSLESQRMLELQNAQSETELKQKEAALLALRKEFASMYKAQYKTLNDLCAAYWSPIKRDKKEMIYEEALRQISVIGQDVDSQNKFMAIVNQSLDGIIDKLKADLPDRQKRDFRFLVLLIVGFDAKTIANLTGYAVGTVYTKKNRLKAEISALDSPNRDFYLEYID